MKNGSAHYGKIAQNPIQILSKRDATYNLYSKSFESFTEHVTGMFIEVVFNEGPTSVACHNMYMFPIEHIWQWVEMLSHELSYLI